MKNSLYKTLKSDRRVFRIYASEKTEDETVRVLIEHYPMLERCIKQSVEECVRIQKRLKDPELIPGLFNKCIELCDGGVLPHADSIVGFFDCKLGGICIGYLPFAITCALIHGCALAVTDKNPERLKKYIISLQKMRDTDFNYISEKIFLAEDILADDPVEIYPHTDAEIKARYRRKIAYLALKNGKSERETALEILKKAKENGRHIGEYLFSTVRSKKRGAVYLVLEALMPACVCIASGVLSGEWLISLMLFLPIWEILRYFTERTSLRGIPPRRLLSLDPYSEKVSSVHALIVLSVILPSADRMSEIKDKLESLYLSNASENIGVCCLGDFKGADMPRKPEDKLILNALNNAIDDLNKKYGGGFIAAVRPRSYSETQNEFIGKERKRGAIRELIRAIKGNKKGFISLEGDTGRIKDTKYLVVLDYDSRPVFDSVRELIAVAEHPVNKPVIKNGRVVSGYGILAPKTQMSLESSKSFFSNVMSVNTGISSYDERSNERYQTLFGESVFCGKGLINVDAYYELLDNALPRERVLSHDIIEGEFLRTGFVSDVQIIEDFPDSADAFFKRLHRWTRGDWQNTGFIFSKNALNFVSRFKLFDNLRRSVTPAVCLGVIIYSAFYQGYAGIAAAVVSAFAICSSDIFDGINSVIHQGYRSVTGLYFSKRLPEALGCFVRAFVSAAYSAREAFVCLDAAIRALWRLLISGDNLLEWTTSAAQNNEDTSALPVSCIPALAVSGALIVFGLPIHRLLGIVILADIPLTVFSNTSVSRRKSDIASFQREYLLSHASAMWGYFEDLCTQENNCLPPDNIQFAPHRAIAKRTSPTNIGLMLACFLAARDFGFITSDELCRRLESSLKSIEKLEKYKANLFNWYDISTLETLPPRFVSAVDSGNFLCCLTAVKEGIREYENECAGLKSVAKKIENIIASTDLSVMYNKRRRLFHIGINPDSGEKTESCYDLYMSEIRMTAYLAVARKYVPKNHWCALDRPIIRSGRHAGIASWTGTMFEYFMADIFVPAPEGSLSDEALRFCLHCQRKKAGRNPFGISESAFYAFDGDLNYQYKAHGVQKLGLRRGLDKENVISPYSSFLTLGIAPRLSLRNLKRLEKLGMTGKYGFYEAADFTPGRNNGGFSVINSFMVHHVGMSFLAVDNLLNEKCMQKRFMKEQNMNGAKSLLEEKPLQGKETFKDVVPDTVMPRLRERVCNEKSVWRKSDKESPKISVLTNGRMTLCIDDTGLKKVLLDGENINIGISDRLELEKKKIIFSDNDLKVKFSDNSVWFSFENDMVNLTVQMYLLKSGNCIIRKYTAESKSESKIKLSVCVNAEKTGNVFIKSGFINGNNEEEVTIEAGEKKDFVFALSSDTTEEDAVNIFEMLETKKRLTEKGKNAFGFDAYQKALSEKYLFNIINANNMLCEELSVFGIMADYPIILYEVDGNDALDSVKPIIIFNKTLRNCGIKNTLVLLNNAPESEKNAVLQAIETFLREEGCNLMLGIGGGVFVFEKKLYTNQDIEKLKKKSSVYIAG